jgi:hypothetical protein
MLKIVNSRADWHSLESIIAGSLIIVCFTNHIRVTVWIPNVDLINQGIIVATVTEDITGPWIVSEKFFLLLTSWNKGTTYTLFPPS